MDNLITILLTISAGIILLAILLATFRFVKGPSVFDRIISIDLMTIASMALIVLISFFMDRIIYLDVAIVYGILSFVGVIIIARYLEDVHKRKKFGM